MRRDPVYRVVIRIFRVVFRLLGLRFTIVGVEHIPRTGPVVLASNHLSYLDFTFVGLAAGRRGRLVRFMAKQSVFDNRFSGPLMRAMRHIPVDRSSGAAAYRRASRAVAAGEPVGIFPEATISRSFELKSFKLGAATLCVREQVPLVPVVLWGAQRTFTVDGQYMRRRGVDIVVHVGDPIVAAPSAVVVDVDAELRRRMSELLAAARRTYPAGADAGCWWQPRSCGGSAPTLAEAGELEVAAAERARVRRAARA